jgi:hypothetical protein
LNPPPRSKTAPGAGGHIPYEGFKAGTAKPAELPGILLAALATLSLGLVLGPEAPLIALGGGLAILFVRLVKKDTPGQVMAVLANSAAPALGNRRHSPADLQSRHRYQPAHHHHRRGGRLPRHPDPVPGPRPPTPAAPDTTPQPTAPPARTTAGANRGDGQT